MMKGVSSGTVVTKFDQVYSACLELFELGQFEPMITALQKCNLSLDNHEEWKKVLELLERLPQDYLYQYLPAGVIYITGLRCVRRYAEAIQFAQHMEEQHGLENSAPIQNEVAAVLNGRQRYAEAQVVLQKIIPSLRGEELGTAWARLGFALFNLKQPWEDAYKNAIPLLEGEELGRCLLNYGYCLSMHQQYEEANGVWLEALVHFKKNAYFKAWIRSNLATIGMNNVEPQAERHLLMAIHDTQNPKAKVLEALIWNGLGYFRMLMGEWRRAEFSFLKALDLAKDVFKQQTAFRGLSQVQYLSGQLQEALETLENALHEPKIPHLLLYVIQAKVYLKLSQTTRAKAVLEKAGKPKFELEEWPWRIAAAELARQENRLDDAVGLLEGLPLKDNDSRADVVQFPLLFDLLRSAGKEVPQPLKYIEGLTVSVQAQGVLHVSVNGRPVDLLPAGRVGELLVFLLEHGGQASLETIGDALYPGEITAKKRRQAIWKLVDKLRETLGWAESILSLSGAYQLDPKATWHYDIAEARQKQQFSGEFLAGIYSDWAIEVGRELQQLDPPPRRDLN